MFGVEAARMRSILWFRSRRQWVPLCMRSCQTSLLTGKTMGAMVVQREVLDTLDR